MRRGAPGGPGESPQWTGAAPKVGVNGVAVREVVGQDAVHPGLIQGRKIEADFFRRGAVLKCQDHTVD